MICKNCGAQIDDNTFLCPECGAPTNYTSQHLYEAQAEFAYEPDKPNKIGLISIVVSVFSIVLGEYFCVMCGIAVIFGIVSLARMKKFNKYNWTAVASFIIAVVSLAMWIVLWVLPGTREWIYATFM
ncbi:MAG: zinc-ribbon domain-containing protein [Clostridia bacterium]|nr:zinc-ribbon domain-containing protein [Clostridia bacterium]